ncbi:hypothetical protein MPS_4928 [Mycobacterium pseudoshottsii JCM 15466]|uniref:GAP family protein n=1 Tax=Mycobacterium TaxID=1763 RepID=UPI00076E4D88|nr:MULTISPECIES: GAP family protein [Mycobacterium]GAQ39965.1 hypothetical protein MPS_4928 [Mycobacterium pseudoshottsii JCM 15466]
MAQVSQPNLDTGARFGPIGARVGNMASYVLFVLLALSTNLLVVAMAALFPDQSRALLDRIQRWLQDNDRPIMIVVGLGFGIWFGFKALHGLGVI